MQLVHVLVVVKLAGQSVFGSIDVNFVEVTQQQNELETLNFYLFPATHELIIRSLQLAF